MRRIVPMMILLLAVSLGSAQGAPINIDFSDYPYAPTSVGSVDLDTASANTWFNTEYGITFSGVYLYYDERDAFDNIGIANDVGETGVGTIYFSDTTNFVTVDWTTINSNDIYLSVYDSANNLLDSFFRSGAGTLSGTETLNGNGISKLVFHDDGGFVGLSTLKYDYDGTTDGTNNDTQRVPEPGTMTLLLGGLAGMIGYGRRRKTA